MKPGLDLDSEEDYEGLVHCPRDIKSNSPMINVNIWLVTGGSGGDNDKESEEENSSVKTKKMHVASPPIIATADSQYQKCKQCQNSCVGVYCYLDPETNAHLLLNHEWLDCWAATSFYLLVNTYLFSPPAQRWRISNLDQATEPQALWHEEAIAPPCPSTLPWCPEPEECSSCTPIFNFNIRHEVATLFFENASSIGLRSSEYNGRHSIQTPAYQKDAYRFYDTGEHNCALTKLISKLQDSVVMVNSGLVHHENTQWTRVCCTPGHLKDFCSIIRHQQCMKTHNN